MNEQDAREVMPYEFESLIPGGPEMDQPLVKVQTEHITALAPLKPRDKDEVVKEMVRAALDAGEDAYYSWRMANGEHVAGISGLMALEMMVAWGNCALSAKDAEWDDDLGQWVFRYTFVDTERRVALPHEERFTPKAVPAGSKFADNPDEQARWRRMQFQIGQTIAKRNAILKGGIPGSVRRMVLQAAQGAQQAQIRESGVRASGSKIAAEFEAYGVSAQALVGKIGKPLKQATVEDVEHLRHIYRLIRNAYREHGPEAGEMTTIDFFGPPRDEPAPAKQEPPERRTEIKHGEPPMNDKVSILAQELKEAGQSVPAREELERMVEEKNKKAETLRAVRNSRNPGMKRKHSANLF